MLVRTQRSGIDAWRKPRYGCHETIAATDNGLDAAFLRPVLVECPAQCGDVNGEVAVFYDRPLSHGRYDLVL